MEFFIKHVGTTPGTKLVNESITYTDDEHNLATFPEPTVQVDCGVIVTPEPARRRWRFPWRVPGFCRFTMWEMFIWSPWDEFCS